MHQLSNQASTNEASTNQSAASSRSQSYYAALALAERGVTVKSGWKREEASILVLASYTRHATSKASVDLRIRTAYMPRRTQAMTMCEETLGRAMILLGRRVA